jgi:hypothetical protein
MAAPFGRLRTMRGAVCAAAVAVLLAVGASPAAAARGHELTGTFGTHCAALPCTGEELLEPDGVAVNEVTHDVYVVDKGAGRVVRFSQAGTFLSEFGGTSATGTGELEAGSSEVKNVATTTGAYNEFQEISAPGIPAGTTIVKVEGTKLELSAPATATETASLSAHQSFESPEAIAVDNACHLREVELGHSISSGECTTFDPSNGDVYVIDAGTSGHFEEHRAVDKYSPAGKYLGQINANGEGRFFRSLDGVAVDPAGAVFVYQETRVVSRYTNGEPNVFVGATAIPLPGAGHPGFALDSEGNFYLAYSLLPSTTTIAKASPTGTVLNPEVFEVNAPSAPVAVDQTTDALFVDDLTTVIVFDSGLTERERLGPLTNGAGIGIDAASEHVFVADAATGKVLDFGPLQPGAPGVEAAAQSVTDVTSESAVVHSEINPRSEVGEKATTYSIQYGPCPSLALCASAPFPSSSATATLAADFVAHPIQAELIGLAPHTAYHWRVFAENEHEGRREVTEGPEGTFTTQTAGPFSLPDARQWQLVSPARKLGALIEPLSEAGITEAAADGSALTYIALTPTTPEPSGYPENEQIISRRNAGGWSSSDVTIPHTSPTGSSVGKGPEYRFFDPALNSSVVQPHGPFNAALSSEASESTAFLHQLADACATSCYRPLVTGKGSIANVPLGIEFGQDSRCEPPGGGLTSEAACGPLALGATEDLGHIVLKSQISLTADPGGHGLYEWSGGGLTPVSVLPGGEVAPSGAGLGGFEEASTRRAISADGSRIAWSTSTPPALYLRANATAPQSASGACDEASKACTIQLDAVTTGSGTSGGGQFQIASADGSRVFFTDANRLTEGAGTVGSDLYECAVVEPVAGEPACRLTDLTPEASGGPAEVQGGVLGASADGSYLYVVAKGELATNSVDNGAGPESARAGQPNLYLVHEGATSFVATLSGGDNYDWSAVAIQPTRVSSDGRFLEFMSQASPTGYDNRDLATGAPVAEVYLYDAQDGSLRCASCDPSGARPVGIEAAKLKPGNGALVGGPNEIWAEPELVAANVPGWTSVALGRPRYQPRYLSDSGRLFFNSINALVPQDSNGTQDVYQYEPPGVGGCSESSPTFGQRSGGCVGLISSGTSREESAFLDASESGDDVFFLTSSRLVAQDEDSARDVYDAHVCTSSEPCLSEPPAPPPACQGDACQQPATPPVDATPGSLTFNGAGNVKECPKGKQLKKGKCVSKQQKKAKKHKKKSNKKNGKKGNGKKSKSAKSNRGGGK